MKVRFTFIFSFLLLFTSLAMAQSSIKGKVISDKGQAVAFATVVLRNLSDSAFVKAAVCNESGTFTIPSIDSGEYWANVSSVGYEASTSRIQLSPNQPLAPFTLKESADMLEEVEVVSTRPVVEVQPDKTVFNVDNNLGTTGSSGLELLRKAPGVILDNNDNMIVEGKSGVQIYIDGKRSVLQGEDLTNYLRSLQASDIESIEIITQPSSKYEAAGNAGIINIILKKEKGLGTNGTLTAGYVYGRYARYNSGLTINNRTRKLNVYANLSNNFGKSYNFFNLLRLQNNSVFDSRSSSVSTFNSTNLKAGLDWFVSDNSIIGVMVNGNLNDSEWDNDSRTPIFRGAATEPEQVLVAGSLTDQESTNLFTNLNYRFTDSLGHSLNIDFDYGRYDNERDNYQPNTFYDGSETTVLNRIINAQVTPVTIDIFSTKADYETRFLKGTLGLGTKLSFVQTDNNFQFYDVEVGEEPVLNPGRSNRFFYDENIYAGYINYNRKWEKLSLQLGLRGENTVSDGRLDSEQRTDNQRVQRNYFNLFPSGGLTYTLSEKSSLALVYSKRIERPNYQTLNPFVFQLNELAFRKGNPFLQPQYTNNAKLSWTYNYRLTVALSYSHVADFFAQVTEIEGRDASFINTRNVANQDVVNLNVSYSTDLFDWWSVYFNGYAYQSDFSATHPDFKPIDQFTWGFYAQNTYTLPAGLKAEVSGWYSSPSIWGGTFETESLGALDIGLQRKWLNDRLSTRVLVSDVFFTSPWAAEAEFGGLTSLADGGRDSRQFRLSLSYTFGGSDVLKARKRNTSLEEESQRLGE